MKDRHTDRRPLVKVCGITNRTDLDCALAFGADYVGFVFSPWDYRYISPEHAADLNTFRAGRVGVFNADCTPEYIATTARRAALDIVQVPAECVAELRSMLRGVRIWGEVNAATTPEELTEAAGLCEAFAADTAVAGARSNALPRPLILTGNIHAGNATELLRRHTPVCIELKAGIESLPALKHPLRLLSAMSHLEQAVG